MENFEKLKKKSTDGAQNFRIEKKNKNKKLSETKETPKCKKPQLSSSKIVISEAFQRVTYETLQESHLKIDKSLAPRTKHKIFDLEKNEQHKIMEDRISFQKQKTATF